MARKKAKRMWPKRRTARPGPMDRLRARWGAGPLAGKQREIVHVPKAERTAARDAEPAGKKEPAGETAKPPPAGKGDSA